MWATWLYDTSTYTNLHHQIERSGSAAATQDWLLRRLLGRLLKVLYAFRGNITSLYLIPISEFRRELFTNFLILENTSYLSTLNTQRLDICKMCGKVVKYRLFFNDYILIPQKSFTVVTIPTFTKCWERKTASLIIQASIYFLYVWNTRQPSMCLVLPSANKLQMYDCDQRHDLWACGYGYMMELHSDKPHPISPPHYSNKPEKKRS